MTTVINVPPSALDDQTFEQVLEQLAPLPADEKITSLTHATAGGAIAVWAASWRS